MTDRRSIGGALLSCLLLVALPSSAQVWTGLAGDNLWSSGGNWSGGVAPTSANTTFLSFPASGATHAPNADAAWTLNHLDISGAPSYGLVGSTLMIDGASPAITVSGAGHTIANPMIFGAITSFTADNDVTLSGDLSGFGGIVAFGAGRITLSGTTTYNGQTSIAGTLRWGDGAIGPGTVFDIFNNGVAEFNVPGGIAINSVMNGSGAVLVSGGLAAGVFGPMQYTGDTTVNAGAQFDAVVANSTSLALDGTFNTTGATFGRLSGTGGQLNINAGLFTVGGDNASTTFNGCVSGLGDLVKVGTGKLTLAVTCMHNGTTSVNAGTLAFGDGVVGPGTLFDIVNNAAVEFNVPGGIAINSVMNGTGSLAVTGGFAAGVFGPMQYTGATTVNAGAQFDALVANSASLTLDGTFNTGGATFGRLSGSGLLNINSGTVTVGSAGTNTTFSGSLASLGSFVKTGAGRLTLSGASTLAGATTVGAGSIALTGSTSSPITVASGATLFGTGTASGGVTVVAGGNLAPGLSPGQINTGNLVLAGNLLQEIEGPALGAQYDNVNVTGTVDVTGATLTLTGGYVPPAGDTFTIITNDGADPVNGTFAGLAEGAPITFNGRQMRISYVGGTGNDVVLTVLAAPAGAADAIPALSEWMLLLLALSLLTLGARAARRPSR
ncbi:MAG: autotransporter-associated beta strand repeat-containing protein [Usitatibacter sp.]